jgi:hypothetical protein
MDESLVINPYSLWWGFSLIAADTLDSRRTPFWVIFGSYLGRITMSLHLVFSGYLPVYHDYKGLKVMSY